MRLAVNALLILIVLLHNICSKVQNARNVTINSGLEKEKPEALKDLKEGRSGNNTVILIMGME